MQEGESYSQMFVHCPMAWRLWFFCLACWVSAGYVSLQNERLYMLRSIMFLMKEENLTPSKSEVELQCRWRITSSPKRKYNRKQGNTWKNPSQGQWITSSLVPMQVLIKDPQKTLWKNPKEMHRKTLYPKVNQHSSTAHRKSLFSSVTVYTPHRMAKQVHFHKVILAIPSFKPPKIAEKKVLHIRTTTKNPTFVHNTKQKAPKLTNHRSMNKQKRMGISILHTHNTHLKIKICKPYMPNAFH